MKTLKIFIALLICNTLLLGNEWTYLTQGIVNSTPVFDGDMVYLGSNDNSLYALNSVTGEYLWAFETGNPVKCEPLIFGENIYITSGSKLFAINKTNGTLVWEYKPDDLGTKSATNFIDEWDYHCSSPFDYEGNIYYGDDFGNINGVSSQNGELKFKYTITEPTHIRTTVNIVNDTLYFGDWEGQIYAVNIIDSSLLWQFSTFESRPYPSFGGIITQPVINKGKLFIGARNYDYNVINISDGSLAWKFNESGGGWITGTPLIINDTLYQGGSDNKQIIAFNAETGEQYWKYNSNKNIFCEPTYFNGKLLFTDGDSYNHNSGKGRLYAIDARTGSEINQYEIGSNSFSSPKLMNDYIYFGSYSKNVHCINYEQFISNTTSVIPNKVKFNLDLFPNPCSHELRCEFNYSDATEVKFIISDLKGSIISENTCKTIKGKNSFIIATASLLDNNNYLVSLYLNNVLLGSKQVIKLAN